MDFWSGKKVLVTGGSGFIGSHLVEHLIEYGALVRVVGRKKTTLDERIGPLADDVDFLVGDLSIREDALSACEGMEAVFHLAGNIAGAGWNSTHPGTMFTENTLFGLHMLDAAAKRGVERYLCVSSACIYSGKCDVPTPEKDGFFDNPDAANFGYGWAKRSMEIQARAYADEFDMKIGIVRPYNGYGPRDDFEWETSHVIPALIRKVVERQDPINVWGDGSQSRSFFYVSDFVKGLVLGLEKYPVCDPINIGTDEEITIKELIQKISQISGIDVNVEFDTTKPQGQLRRNGDFKKAERLLGFKASVPLDEGIGKTIAWYLNSVQTHPVEKPIS